jgi:hypothetical protein
LRGTVDARALTCTIFASRLGAFWLQVADYCTFTFVAEPLTRLVKWDSADEAEPHRRAVVDDSEGDGSSGTGAHWQLNIVGPSVQCALGLPSGATDEHVRCPLDYVGHIESLASGGTFQGYLRYNLKRGVRVDPVLFKPTPEKAAFIRSQSEKSELWQALHDEPQLLCDVAHAAV